MAPKAAASNTIAVTRSAVARAEGLADSENLAGLEDLKVALHLEAALSLVSDLISALVQVLDLVLVWG